MRIKICGITNLEDAFDAINAGANALGFVFYEKSPRYITPLKAKEIIELLPPFIQTVGLFVNENSTFINEVTHISKIQLSQIIDDKNIVDYDNLDAKYLEVARIKEKDDLLKLEKNRYYLVDAFVESFGGAGKRIAIEWFEDKNIDCSKLIIAGGLTSQNLHELKGFNFYGVDVSSGVEESKGKKSKSRMNEFVKKVNEI